MLWTLIPRAAHGHSFGVAKVFVSKNDLIVLRYYCISILSLCDSFAIVSEKSACPSFLQI